MGFLHRFAEISAQVTEIEYEMSLTAGKGYYVGEDNEMPWNDRSD